VFAEFSTECVLYRRSGKDSRNLQKQAKLGLKENLGLVWDLYFSSAKKLGLVWDLYFSSGWFGIYIPHPHACG